LKGETRHERLIALSDGVFAFSMTLMVLTIDVPKLENVAARGHAEGSARSMV
jgi:uncharacterized membrane protein